MARRQVDQLDTPAVEKGVVADEKGVGPLAHKGCEGRIDLAAGAGVEDLDLQPHGAGSRSTSLNVVSVFAALAGLTSTATRVAAGTSSRRSSSRFAVNSPLKKLIPVRLPPGRARLATRPSLTGSSATTKTMGIVVVAALAANAEADLRARRSRRPAGEPNRPPAPAADPFDSRPSGIRSPRSRPRHSRSPSGPGEIRADGRPTRQAIWGLRNPITGIAGCCARAASGHAAAPPSSVMNSRRLTRSPRRRGRAGSGNSRPSALAVLRLIMSSNPVACWTGRSPGFAPFRIRST